MREISVSARAIPTRFKARGRRYQILFPKKKKNERKDNKKAAHLAEPIDGVGQQVRQVLVVSGSRVLHSVLSRYVKRKKRVDEK